jgi:two-component system CheB/CheR fusion protein
MPADSGMAFVLVQHLPPDRESMIAEILARNTAMPVLQVEDGIRVEVNHVYVIRPGHTLTIEHGALHLGARLERERHGRPVDDFFRSLAQEQRQRAICIIMSGMGSNGSAGAQAIKAVGGLGIAQAPESAQFASMPRHLIEAGYADFVLRPREMPDALIGYAQHPYAATDGDSAKHAPQRERQSLSEILAILRTRTHQDFSGYRKPTIWRRIERRMGLNRIALLDEYVAFLRRNPIEVGALADDLLIHVTGFFRDPAAWEALREQVIVPLIAEREPDSHLRCWVTACSTGEEAYSLAILLVEECERVGKPLDIKVFATDTAERTLSNARNGVYPGGIEAEMSFDRLSRFFQRDDAVYRVRQDLRERVVFAPQNVLADPPFSRLDIVCCRNLLIYLEPQVQQRVIALLHFGLRSGGFLFLGTSESVGGTEDMFIPIDKKARIFKRIGPPRHASVDFPLPSHIRRADDLTRTELRAGPRLSVAQVTAHTLVAHHVPAAVTVDRDLRVVYFQGNTGPFLNHPTGEPTRDLLSIANESVRGSVRAAMQRAITEGKAVTVSDGMIQTLDGPRRVLICASPVESRSAEHADLYVVSFQEREEPPQPAAPALGQGGRAPEELQRIRDELQSTVEELQTSNEEHKAAAEEIMSINEELQSSNEELETSKEEMQSLNEELSTVNSQLQSKIEEFQALTNDLGSLLSSTDIAVIFLDPSLRIRRYTPAATKLIELISTDVGRPLQDLATKFTDPDLLADSQSVLSTLVPLQKEIMGASGRSYVRRVLPYRTTDNRIDGVVVTFVDTSDLRKAEDALRVSTDKLEGERRAIESLQDAANRGPGGPDLNDAMHEVLQAAMRIDDTGRGTVHVFDPETRSLSLIVHVGMSPELTDHWSALHAQQDAAPTRAAHSRERVVMDDAMASTSSAEDRLAAAKGGYRAVVSIPLLTRSREILGVLSTYFEHAYLPADPAHRVMDIFARQAADLIERIRSERELSRLLRLEHAARVTLDEAARTKDEFLAVLSHELRTPLSAILGWAKAIQMQPIDPSLVAEGLASISSSGQSLTRLVDDLLDHSRAAAGRLQLEMRPVDLGEALMIAMEAIRPLAEARGVSVKGESSGRLVVTADADRLGQVLWNLLNNAVRFTASGGHIHAKLAHEGNDAVVRIVDTGSGIASEFLPFVFDRFRQYDSARTRRRGGLGLGLAIAKQLVELHGGTIGADSAGLGHGSTFTVRLPLSPHNEAPVFATAQHNEPVSLRGVCVLLVEDDQPTRRVLQELLQQAGAQVSAVASVGEAMECFVRSRPAIILSDIGLPDEDGFVLVQRIRSLEDIEGQGCKRTPAIALTAFASEQDRQRALAAGFDQHLAKPVDPQRLVSAIRALVPESSTIH